MPDIKIISVTTEQTGIRLDKFLSDCPELELTRSAVQNRLADGSILVDGKSVKKNYTLRGTEQISVNLPEPESLEIVPENIPLEIVYEDDDLLVVNKPKGMVVHPAPGHSGGTLVNALMYHCGDRLSGINGVIRPGIVHRIDMNTSGLLMVAKNDKAHLALSAQIQEHSFTREYIAVAMGKFKELSGTISAPIGRHPTDRKKMCVTEKNSRTATTHFKVLAQMEKAAYVRLKLETGRTHQIRVHLSYIGHPVLGDDVYGKAYKGIEGQCLHAKKLGFIHPTTQEYMEFESEVPEYFQKILRSCGYREEGSYEA